MTTYNWTFVTGEGGELTAGWQGTESQAHEYAQQKANELGVHIDYSRAGSSDEWEAEPQASFTGEGEDRVSTRSFPRPEAERIASELRATGHDVSVAPDSEDRGKFWVYAHVPESSESEELAG